MKRILSNIGYYVGKYTWNAFIGIIFIVLVLGCVLFKLFGELGAKLAILVGAIVFVGDIILLICGSFPSIWDWLKSLGKTLLFAFGPAFVVAFMVEVLKKLAVTVRDNCFID